MFGYYILPFHKDYNDSSSCHTPVSSNPTSRNNSADDLDYVAKQYVDDKLVIKETNDLTSDKHKKWIETIEDLEVIRRTRQKRWTDNRQTVESNKLHKTTCLIWCIAGGVESDDECCPYDDDGCTPVDYQNSSNDVVATNDRGTDSAVFLHCALVVIVSIYCSGIVFLLSLPFFYSPSPSRDRSLMNSIIFFSCSGSRVYSINSVISRLFRRSVWINGCSHIGVSNAPGKSNRSIHLPHIFDKCWHISLLKSLHFQDSDLVTNSKIITESRCPTVYRVYPSYMA
ncbi:hypothetical protein BATDEDRAFT_23070 [Batrachochytrium dendrobatidis JAM81]|uniref:Uncharacterized protein n=1 Tax=Batrachochytrium dendrobatidis (strain JAM81 / FGSC 10211) TaxID=684364 RepID=F4NWM7_BATDJ|nr:uncharacterized protein BATDEDRAFT_23070 [Batrachochytrium dendrobatidis JAM81]EGF82854.1 hypothetical protein BATDEDRAFT_23070 [Batrachochytrium dendrobatidis JAM81]|eukprot:XP_006676696.1 hypothetical protein BATDEDRAFT_23070 [Batrachochytrium dendrobatidis JAM81]